MKPATRTRTVAWLIDILIALGLAHLFIPLGWGAAGLYWLVRDGLFDGQSIGKRVMGLKVIVLPNNVRCTILPSAIRNVLWIIPFVGIVMAIVAVHAQQHDPDGRHWGDRLADTRVVRV